MRLIWLLVGGCFVTEAEVERALDRDRDGFQPVVTGGDDCDEGRADVNPGAVEVCGDGVDNDCDGRADDDGIGARLWFRDSDGDGYGIEETVSACSVPPGYAELVGDCNDSDASINPAARDLCDGIDQDCDGIADDEVALILKYPDADGDGFGVEEGSVYACDDLVGFVLVGGDCDDTNDQISPAAIDLCDGLDQNCNGLVDEDVVFLRRFRDDDGDGYGVDTDTLDDCGVVPGYALQGGDCNDQNGQINPGALDLCDGADQNCNGIPDEDAPITQYFLDADNDGVGDSNLSLETCGSVPGYVLASGDCDDTNPAISPLVLDTCDGLDQNCNGVVDDDAVLTLYFEDADLDGIGRSDIFVEACLPPPGYSQLSGDCNDSDASVQPGSVDPCDGIDQDCDGAIDEDGTFSLWFEDADGDGLGDQASAVSTCDGAPTGFVAVSGDCDDGDGLITVPTWYRDADGDGFGVSQTASACTAPAGYAAMAGDCDDTLASVNPGRSEVCNNGLDDDCDDTTNCRLSGSYFASDADRSIPIPSNASNLAILGDVVGNGADDIAVWRPGAIDIYRGGGSFQLTSPAASIPGDGVLGSGPDVTGDGRSDLVFRDYGTDYTWVIAGGQSGTLSPSMRILDALGDAVLVADSGSGPGIWMGDPNFGSGAGRLSFIPFGPGDADSLDVTTTVNGAPNERLGRLEVLSEFESSAFPALVANPADSGVQRIRIFGDLDPGTHTSSASVWEYTSSSTLVGAYVVPSSSGTSSSLSIGELNLTIPTSSRIDLFQGPLSSTFDPQAPDFSVESHPGELAALFPVGDMDGDGVSEVVGIALGAVPRFSVLYGAEDTSLYFADASAYLVPPGSDADLDAFRVGDVNGDGRTDLLLYVSDPSIRTLYVYYGRGQ
ncbi:MAG: putative metal-binding motif-containing protein [Myxococcota bacterium]